MGGIKFYERAEIKDAVSYLRIINQKFDDLALERVIGIPKRGVGESTLNQIYKYGKTNNNIDSNFIEELIIKRNKAREGKNFQEADKIRDELTNINIEIEDTINGTIWRSKN